MPACAAPSLSALPPAQGCSGRCRGLTSWRMSSSRGTMESSSASSLRRQGGGSGQPRPRGLGEQGSWSPAPPGPRGWGQGSGRGQSYSGGSEAGRSPVLDQSYHLGVGLPNDTFPVHLHQPVSWGQGTGPRVSRPRPHLRTPVLVWVWMGSRRQEPSSLLGPRVPPRVGRRDPEGAGSRETGTAHLCGVQPCGRGPRPSRS